MAPSTEKSSIPLQIASYYILPLSLPSLPSLDAPPATHYLYLRPHEPKIPSPTTPRSLFLVNKPFDTTETHLKHLFSVQLGLPTGRIENVNFEGQKGKEHGDEEQEAVAAQIQIGKKNKKRKRVTEEEELGELEGADLPRTWDRDIWRAGSTAVLVFVDKASMEAAVKAVRSVRKSKGVIVWGEGVDGKIPALGSQRMSSVPLHYMDRVGLATEHCIGYLIHHRLSYPDKTELLESVNNYMTAYANQEAARTRRLQRLRQEPDEDGFITVTKGGRTGPATQETAKEILEKQKVKQKGLEDFYRFQSREKKKERAGELIRKFEEDRDKVRKMREKRGRFKVCYIVVVRGTMLML